MTRATQEGRAELVEGPGGHAARPAALQLNADAKSQFFATGPLASWVPRFLEQDKV